MCASSVLSVASTLFFFVSLALFVFPWPVAWRGVELERCTRMNESRGSGAVDSRARIVIISGIRYNTVLPTC